MPSTAVTQGRLCLVDAHACLHRAYHALPPLKNSAGEPVGALYGFARMLFAIQKREKPDFLAVCFDSPGPTFRHAAYADYKATRKETDEDLKSQLKLARPLTAAFGFHCVELSGYEADDLIATLTARGLTEGISDILLVTSDKDAMQLVGDHVKVMVDINKDIFDADKVAEKFGVRPSQIADYLALVGDTSDNVPGVPGIGPVGAVKLLKEFGNLDRIMKAARAGDKALSPKLAKTLTDGEEKLRLSRDLVTLKHEAPIAGAFSDCRVSPVHRDELMALLQRFEFNSLIRDVLGETPAASASAAVRSETKAAGPEISPLSPAAWLKVAAGASRFCAAMIRMPATELFEEDIDGSWSLALSLSDGRACWIGGNEIEEHRALLAKLFASKAEVIGHDLKKIACALSQKGLTLPEKRFDTLLAAYCLNPSRTKYELSSIAAEYSIGGAAESGAHHSRGTARILPRGAAAESKEETRATVLDQTRLVWPLAEWLNEGLKAKNLQDLYFKLEMPLLEVLAEMESRGIGIDDSYLSKLRKEFEERIGELKAEIDKIAGREINVNSPKQLGALLFEELKLPTMKKTAGGGASTDEDTLRSLMPLHPLPAKVIDYRELSKLKSTYIEGLLQRMDPKTHRVHTHFNQAGTATGRLSSVDPNLQNIPIRTPLGQKIRRAFVAKKDCVLLSADYSQIDLRVLAHLSDDASLVSAFQNHEDVHLRTACEIFEVSAGEVDAELRRRAKAVNFGIVYGQTAHGLSQELGIPRAKAQEYIQKYMARCFGVAKWSQATLENARRDGYVKTLLGRVRWLPDIMAKNGAVRQFNERVAVNTPIQGTSADIIKKAMINIFNFMREHPDKWKSQLLLQVHDDLLFETPEEEAESFAKWVKKEMETAVTLSVPLVVAIKVGSNWQDMKPVGKQ